MKEVWNFNLSFIRNIVQACKLFVVLIVYPNWLQKGMSPPPLFYMCVCASLHMSGMHCSCAVKCSNQHSMLLRPSIIP
jgi:hypothetical protein